jgi:hypothetical protein
MPAKAVTRGSWLATRSWQPPICEKCSYRNTVENSSFEVMDSIVSNTKMDNVFHFNLVSECKCDMAIILWA